MFENLKKQEKSTKSISCTIDSELFERFRSLVKEHFGSRAQTDILTQGLSAVVADPSLLAQCPPEPLRVSRQWHLDQCVVDSLGALLGESGASTTQVVEMVMSEFIRTMERQQ